jgi:hypothetical protein
MDDEEDYFGVYPLDGRPLERLPGAREVFDQLIDTHKHEACAGYAPRYATCSVWSADDTYIPPRILAVARADYRRLKMLIYGRDRETAARAARVLKSLLAIRARRGEL